MDEDWRDVSFIGSAYDMQVNSKGEYRHCRARATRNTWFRNLSAYEHDIEFLNQEERDWIAGMAPDFKQSDP